MYNLTKISDIKLLLKKHDFNFTKSLGQNFIINPYICPKMIELSNINEEYLVIEIGPGIGVLTQQLCENAKKVISIEIDKRLIPVLNETLSEYDNYKIINEDILKVDLKNLILNESNGLKVCFCANLPYYITSPVIMKILEINLDIDFITVMVQKETAQRMVVDFKNREVGAITYAIRYYSEPKILFNVDRNSFIPSPNVDSSVIYLKTKKDKYNLNEYQKEFLFTLIREVYKKRRKIILNPLSEYLKISKNEIIKILENVNINCNARPENLTLDDFYNIIKELKV